MCCRNGYILDCIALLSAYACYGHYRHALRRNDRSAFQLCSQPLPRRLDQRSRLTRYTPRPLGYYPIRLHSSYLAVAMVRQSDTLPQLDAYVLDAVRHSLRSSTLPPKVLPFLSEKSQHAYIECSVSAKDAKEAGGDNFLTMYLHMLLLEMLPGDTSLSTREVIATINFDSSPSLSVLR